ncbi:MAG: hypothetical protein ACQEXX_01755 [Bacillota bacterium]
MKYSIKIALVLVMMITIAINQVTISSASEAVKTDKSAIQEVIYDQNDQVYYGISKPDNGGGQWVIYISKKKYSEHSLLWLNKTFKNKPFEIRYTGDSDTNNDVEIINIKWLSLYK